MKSLQIQAVVTANEEVMPRFYRVWLEAPEIAAVARPGQFLMVRCGHEVLLRRPLSVHRISKDRKKLAPSQDKGSIGRNACNNPESVPDCRSQKQFAKAPGSSLHYKEQW